MQEHINKMADLKDFLKDTPAIVSQGYDENHFETDDGAEYLVLTDEEADKATRDEIESLLWAFRADFILKKTGFSDKLSSGEWTAMKAALEEMQNKTCESCNEFIKGLINGTCGLDEFVAAAIEADGRGHFLAYYDGEENEQGDSFIYRVN